MSFNFIRRSPLKKVLKEHKESAPWRRRKIRLDGKEMANLRHEVYMRSAMRCENAPFIDMPGERCPVWISWYTGELAHIEDRGKGGSDTRNNVLFTCHDCHFEHTRNRRKLVPHKEWQP